MSYPSNPREVRSLIESVHTSYVHGETLFPRGRLLVEPEQLPTKSQAIANALMKDWQHIDEDNCFFEASKLIVLGRINQGEGQSARVITKVGLNAVKWAYIDNYGEKNTVYGGTWSIDEAETIFGSEMWGGSGDSSYQDGVLNSDLTPTLQIVRDSRYGEPVVSKVYLPPIGRALAAVV